ncbi:kinase-like protein [Calocera viscosa TUFC12733]|uniref:Kinase-like protein n=1 Tax=Calocera viscosa (strain TUFC12733) TaxID=1330018 RepID=A0A167NB92_CALVF|nr:kinase-like protein [Calocera viscosa TUFC12733]
MALRLDDRHLIFRPEDRVTGGSFGDVYKLMISHAGVMALKVPRSSVQPRRKVLCRAIREALTWSLLTHENILPLQGIGWHSASEQLCMSSEWMSHGNIRQYLASHPDSDRHVFLPGIAAGLQYLQEHVPPIVHGDIKGNNVLISEDLRPLLTDFGQSSVLEITQKSKSTTSSAIANARWSPPELLQPEEYGLRISTSRTPGGDIFSMLRTFLEILTDDVPFRECSNNFHVIRYVMSGNQPQRPTDAILSDRMWKLMCFVWSQGPFDRPSAREVVKYINGETLSMALSITDINYKGGGNASRTCQPCRQSRKKCQPGSKPSNCIACEITGVGYKPPAGKVLN